LEIVSLKESHDFSRVLILIVSFGCVN